MLMQKYGILDTEGNLFTSSKQIDGHKPVKYAEIPKRFDETKHYLLESEPIDKGDHIYIGNELHELAIEDDEFDEDLF